MITASKLTRLALEIGVPAHVFTETANNLRALNEHIFVRYLMSDACLTPPEEIELSIEDWWDARYTYFRHEFIKNLLDESPNERGHEK